MSTDSEYLDELVGQIVVIDARSTYIYVGKLVGADHRYVILEEVDVHDLRDTNTTREKYVVDSKLHGVKQNRARTLVNHDEVVSLSALADVEV